MTAPVLVQRTHGARRLAWGLLALIQFVTLVSVPLADAALESRSERVAHVESESGSACSLHHDHLFCQLCRVLEVRAHTVEARLAPLDRGPTCSDASPGVEGVRLVLHEPFSPLGPRAPPSA